MLHDLFGRRRGGHRPAWVLVDAGATDEQAARLYSAFDTWINAVLADPNRRRQVGRRVASGPVIPSETLFGPDAVGGYLCGPPPVGRWKLLTPKGKDATGPPGAGAGPRVRTVRYADPSGEPVHTLGSGD